MQESIETNDTDDLEVVETKVHNHTREETRRARQAARLLSRTRPTRTQRRDKVAAELIESKEYKHDKKLNRAPTKYNRVKLTTRSARKELRATWETKKAQARKDRQAGWFGGKFPLSAMKRID